jgi:hypothetical protein
MSGVAGTGQNSGQAQIALNGSGVGNAFMEILDSDDIRPGDSPSYELCKLIYLYHPLGQKMAGSPIKMAQSQRREITVQNGPENRLVERFWQVWDEIGADALIFNLAEMSRVYGYAMLLGVADGIAPTTQLTADLIRNQGKKLVFNVLDPLNSVGSMSYDQDPNSPTFMKLREVEVAGTIYNPTRACVLINENPIYLAFSSSSYAFTGRSVYQRALFPLKTFLQTMKTDDLVARKCGVLVAKMKTIGSTVDKFIKAGLAWKRNLLKEARTDNVITIGETDEVESLDLKNLEGPLELCRKHALENCAVANDMPAKILNNETFAEGFGEGTEDAKNIARYIDTVRMWLNPAYLFLENIVRLRAWDEDFYNALKKEFKAEIKATDFQTAFNQWCDDFKAVWPNLLVEPESEKSKTEKVRLDSLTASFQAILATNKVDDDNFSILMDWYQNNLNSNETLFPNPLTLDAQAMAEYQPPPPPGMEAPEGGSEGEDTGEGSPGAQAASETAKGKTSNRPGPASPKPKAPGKPDATPAPAKKAA